MSWSEHRLINAKVMGIIPIWAIHLDTCGSFTQSLWILWIQLRIFCDYDRRRCSYSLHVLISKLDSTLETDTQGNKRYSAKFCKGLFLFIGSSQNVRRFS